MESPVERARLFASAGIEREPNSRQYRDLLLQRPQRERSFEQSSRRPLESSKFRPDQFLYCKLHNPFNGDWLWITEAPGTGIDTRFSVPLAGTRRWASA